MTGSQLFRIGGLTLVAGAIAFIAHLVARSAVTAGADPATLYQGGLWVPINVLGALGAALVLLGLPATYARIAGTAGVVGLVGVVLIALAWLFFGVFLSLYGALVAPWLANQAPALVASSAPLPFGFLVAFLVGILAELVGTVLLAIPFLRGRVQPRWVAYALPAAAILTVIGDLLAPTGPAANLGINLLSNVGPVVLMVALGELGFRTWSEHRPVKQAETKVHLSPG
jgi:hypothetical protein